jgi:hypothetical protein
MKLDVMRPEIVIDINALEHTALGHIEADAAKAAAALIAVRFLSPIGSRSADGTSPTCGRIVDFDSIGPGCGWDASTTGRTSPGELLIGPPGGPMALCRILGQRR